MLKKIWRLSLWITTILALLLIAAQGWTGNWSIFYLLWPGSNVSNTFILFTAGLDVYHMRMGMVIGALSILIIILTFLSRSSAYVRILAFLGLAVIVSATLGGIEYVNSGLQDRLSLGQMADSFLGAFAVYFLMLFFLNKTPGFLRGRENAT